MIVHPSIPEAKRMWTIGKVCKEPRGGEMTSGGVFFFTRARDENGDPMGSNPKMCLENDASRTEGSVFGTKRGKLGRVDEKK
ncbi:unnamed protein product [Caenorhabditis auriculariae]|uniref:Uncharacterized protein n=1 Tax=Caenorhabditis auriculariae TaxID=2777116 RepID=A0A8S1HLT7_9PELO|nr:unnamed protein product [Caenorhabditis auriculariae]